MLTCPIQDKSYREAVKSEVNKAFQEADSLRYKPSKIAGTWLDRVIKILLFIPRLYRDIFRDALVTLQMNFCKNPKKLRTLQIKQIQINQSLGKELPLGGKIRFKPRKRLVKTYNCHRVCDGGFTTKKSFKGQKIDLYSPEGVCLGESVLFLNYLKKFGSDLTKEQVIQGAALFRKGAPRAATLLQASVEATIDDKSRKVLSKNKSKGQEKLGAIPSGRYELYTARHMMGLVKLKDGPLFLFDPNHGLYAYKKGEEQNLAEDLSLLGNRYKGTFHKAVLKEFEGKERKKVKELLKKIEKNNLSKKELGDLETLGPYFPYIKGKAVLIRA